MFKIKFSGATQLEALSWLKGLPIFESHTVESMAFDYDITSALATEIIVLRAQFHTDATAFELPVTEAGEYLMDELSQELERLAEMTVDETKGIPAMIGSESEADYQARLSLIYQQHLALRAQAGAYRRLATSINKIKLGLGE